MYFKLPSNTTGGQEAKLSVLQSTQNANLPDDLVPPPSH